ncbi:MAG TPA: 3-ketoacyl-ACP reductase [Polyangiaceae bacterium]|nr:3-ketoacyl-ACP reductase [Polyangiaceae bacterium]
MSTRRRTALITGGSRGIGFGIAECLAREGYALAINGVRAEAEVAPSLEQLRALGADVLYAPGDVGSDAGRRQVLERTLERFGPPHVLVNNAGVAPRERRDILEMTAESYERVLGTNLGGPLFLTQLVAKEMLRERERDEGFAACIINVSSISATVVSTNRGEYCIAKAGLSMVTQLFAARLGPLGIPVYEVRPGVIKTDMTAGVTAKYDQLIDGGLCVQPRWGLPDDVGRAVAALARGDFPYSTGQVIMVDGGLVIPRL